jgi:hypothetical protein
MCGSTLMVPFLAPGCACVRNQLVASLLLLLLTAALAASGTVAMGDWWLRGWAVELAAAGRVCAGGCGGAAVWLQPADGGGGSADHGSEVREGEGGWCAASPVPPTGALNRFRHCRNTGMELCRRQVASRAPLPLCQLMCLLTSVSSLITTTHTAHGDALRPSRPFHFQPPAIHPHLPPAMMSTSSPPS